MPFKILTYESRHLSQPSGEDRILRATPGSTESAAARDRAAK